MTDCFYAPMLFGETNEVPKSVITSNVAPTTSIEWLKNEDPAEQTRWENAPNNIQIEITLLQPEEIGYFAIPLSNLTEVATLQLELFATTGSLVDALNLPVQTFGSLEENCGVFAVWFDNISAQRARVTIAHNTTGNVDLRMLAMGKSRSLSYNFNYGATLRGMAPPKFHTLYSGRTVKQAAQKKARSFEGRYSHLSDNDSNILWDLEQRLQGDALMINPYPEQNRPGWFTGRAQMLARFQNVLPHTHVLPGSTRSHSTQFRLVEA